MYHDLRNGTLQDKVFFIMVWIFYSLNAKYIQLPNSDILRWIIMFLLLAVTAIKRGRYSMPSFIILFSIGVIPSLFTSISQMTSVVKFLSYLALTISTSMYFSKIRSEFEMERAFRLMINVILIFNALSVIVMLTGNGYSGDRATGITTNANTLGIYANLSLLSSFYYRDRLERRSAWVTLSIFSSIVLALLSGSRTAFVSLIINLIMLMIFDKSSFTKTIAPAAVLYFLYIAISGKQISFMGLNRLLEQGTDRDVFWTFGLSIWRAYPIFGCGYTVSNLLNYGITGADSYHMAFHNSYISMLAEIGLWGTVLIGGGVLLQGIQCLKLFRRDAGGNSLSAFSIVCLMMAELLLAAYSESFLFAAGSTEAFSFWTLFMWAIVYKKKYNHGDFKEEEIVQYG